jgi:hypothetical protein
MTRIHTNIKEDRKMRGRKMTVFGTTETQRAQRNNCWRFLEVQEKQEE